MHPALGPEKHTQAAVAVANGVSLLAWADDRADRGSTDILATRYASDGSLMDASPIRVGMGYHADLTPAIASGDGVFFVVWWAITRSPNGHGGDGLIRGARVALDGTVLDPDGIDLATNAGPPAVTFADGRFYVAFESNDGAALRGMTVSPSGAVVSPPVVIDEHGFWPSLASDGQHVMLSYLREVTVEDRSRRVVLLDAQVQPIAEQSWSVPLGGPSLIAGGPTGFAVSYANGGGLAQSVRRLDASGGWLDAAWIDVPSELGIARDGTGYLVLSGDGVRRLDDGSDALGPPAALPGDVSGHRFTIASDGNDRILAWDDQSEVHSVRLEASGAFVDSPSRAAPRGATAQLAPVLGTQSGQTFIAFTEMSEGDSSIRYGLFDPTAANPVSGMHEIAGATAPALAGSDGSMLLVWSSTAENQVLAASVAGDGTLGAPHVLPVDDLAAPQVTATATSAGYVVLVHEVSVDDHGWGPPVVRALTLSSGGDVVKDADLGRWEGTAVAAVGDDVVVALQKHNLYAAAVEVRCLSNDGTLTFGALAPGDPPAIASDGSAALVVWTDDASRRIQGMLVDGDCSPAIPFPITEAGHEALSPSVFFDGTTYLVTWRELGSPGSDLHATRVASDGSVLDPSGFVLAAEPEKELRATFGPAAAGSTLVAYPRFDPAANALRIWVRSLD